MNVLDTLQTAVGHPVLGIYLWIWAGVLAFGALAHVNSMLGKSGTPRRETPRLWQIMDVTLLIFNVIAVIGLVQRTAWGIIWVIIGLILFQFIPYTVLQHHFAKSNEDRKTLRGLLGTHLLMITILVVLVRLGL